MSKPWPILNSDEEAERFIAEADLSEYDFSVGYRAHLVRRKPAVGEQVLVSVSPETLAKAEERAKAEGAKTPLSLYLGGLVHDAMQREAA